MTSAIDLRLTTQKIRFAKRDGKSKTVQADTYSTLSQFGADYGWQTIFTNDRTKGVQF